jgi:hypothetical protein
MPHRAGGRTFAADSGLLRQMTGITNRRLYPPRNSLAIRFALLVVRPSKNQALALN